jgi:uncharacterized protein YoxC
MTKEDKAYDLIIKNLEEMNKQLNVIKKEQKRLTVCVTDLASRMRVSCDYIKDYSGKVGDYGFFVRAVNDRLNSIDKTLSGSDFITNLVLKINRLFKGV